MWRDKQFASTEIKCRRIRLLHLLVTLLHAHVDGLCLRPRPTDSPCWVMPAPGLPTTSKVSTDVEVSHLTVRATRHLSSGPNALRSLHEIWQLPPRSKPLMLICAKAPECEMKATQRSTRTDGAPGLWLRCLSFGLGSEINLATWYQTSGCFRNFASTSLPMRIWSQPVGTLQSQKPVALMTLSHRLLPCP